MDFEFFDSAEEVHVGYGRLPHWHQPGVTFFMTMRTEDSMPRIAADSWRRRRAEWLRSRGVDPDAADWRRPLASLPLAIQRTFHAQFTQEFEEHLDRGHGACVLARPELARLVAEALRYFDGTRYLLGDFVVMSNHVHVLACLAGETELQAQCASWKRYTALQINRVLGRRGRFWQEESFDHLVRGPEQLERFQRYIAENPDRAKLRPEQYLLWQREGGLTQS